MRQSPLESGQVYHIYSKSIADYVVFNSRKEFLKMTENIRFYRDADARTNPLFRPVKPSGIRLAKIVAYCLMPTHFHLIVQQLVDDGISLFMNRTLNSYTRYFNAKNKRKGPLWEGRFNRILVDCDEYLLHLTRYVHLNPVTAYLVNFPEHWEFSSFSEYVGINQLEGICEFKDLVNMSSKSYSEFVKSRSDYQRTLANIKYLLLEKSTAHTA